MSRKKPAKPAPAPVQPPPAPDPDEFSDHPGKRKVYGYLWPKEASDLEIELVCFRERFKEDDGGLGTYGHFVQCAGRMWPELKWHEWMKWRLRSLCQYSTNVWAGCGAAGKTFDAGVFAMTFFAADPHNTVVILTSTTGKMVRKRIWPVIQELYYRCVGFPGNLVDSKTMLQARKGDDKHGIFAMAVREGSTSKAVADIQGLHAKRMLLVIDEATDTPEAVFEAITNLRKGCDDFNVLVIGNPLSHVDPHGICAEPEEGWQSVSVDDEEWSTRGVPKWDIDPGVCLHFDGLKSPNIRLGEKKYPFLITQADVDRAMRAEGGEMTAGFWKFTRGFWAPDGVCSTVFSGPMITSSGSREKDFTFISRSFMASGLDPAFEGGDRCVQWFARVGDLPDGRTGLFLLEPRIIKARVNSPDPIHVQIAEQVVRNCVEHNIKPEHFGLDSTGEGGGLADHIVRTWGTNSFRRIEFGGAASELPVSKEDQRPSKDVYLNRVTELWFSAREYVMAGQVRGIRPELERELCARLYELKGKRKQVEPKKVMRKRVGFSPDFADAFTVLMEVVRLSGYSAGGKGSKWDGSREWNEFVRKMDNVMPDEETEFAVSNADTD
jgi:hypothetical protein